jgi:hypothetical protein
METELAPLSQASGIQSATNINSNQPATSSSTSSSQGVASIQNLNLTAQAFLSSATDAYNTQAYFGSSPW